MKRLQVLMIGPHDVTALRHGSVLELSPDLILQWEGRTRRQPGQVETPPPDAGREQKRTKQQRSSTAHPRRKAPKKGQEHYCPVCRDVFASPQAVGMHKMRKHDRRGGTLPRVRLVTKGGAA